MNPKAGALPRVVAFIIDNVVFGLVIAAATAVFRPGSFLLQQSMAAAIATTYFTLSWSAVGGGRTVGMRVMKLRLVRTDGTLLSLGGALLRNLGLFVSMAAAFVGVIWVVIDKDKQGWMDKIAGTYMLRE
jgi:uncharacterized RDD family membrane protein YckC